MLDLGVYATWYSQLHWSPASHTKLSQNSARSPNDGRSALSLGSRNGDKPLSGRKAAQFRRSVILRLPARLTPGRSAPAAQQDRTGSRP